jgi:glycosyltransferase involved in cell wall biosynthesis
MNSASMTIVHMIAQLRFGAGRVVVDTAIEQIRNPKNSVIVCVSPDVDDYWRTDPKLVLELESHGIRVLTIGDFFRRQAAQMHQCGTHVRDLRKSGQGAFIVHAHTAMAAAAGHWAHPDALIATCHGWGAKRPADIDLEDSLAYQLCDSVVTYSSHWADRLKNDMARPDAKVIVMGLDLDRYPQMPEKSISEAAPLRLVTACELTLRKGVDLLLDAMLLLWKEMPNTELHIMGDGDVADRLRRTAAQIDPGKQRIKFYGTVAKPYERIAEFDLFVLASRSDNLPVILLESMLARLPIVATEVGGIPELISAAECGIIVPPESTEALTEGVLKAARSGRQAMLSLGIKGEQYARTRLDVHKTTLELEAIYCGALQNRRSGLRTKQ